jgi:hypothetical protein
VGQISLERVWIVVSYVQVSELDVKYWDLTSFGGGFKEWKLEEFQRIHWVILSKWSEYSKNWRIAEIEEVLGSIIRFYVMIGWWWWFNVKFYYLSYILGWKEGARMESSTLSWYWRIVSSSWRFILPFTFGSCSYLWKSLISLNNNCWLFLIYCAWCIVVYWCNSYTIVHCSLDIVEWFNYKLKKVLNCTWYWFTPLSVSTCF